ncbi:hypothetical protein RND71_043713 [Anisodus tanguticus]|uniref:Piwi domain-containing protein n=1 Tax=Anisodus tanguticus TaxID=243964 RepID=A0AAE1QPA5_9SOLA|nr:hypothetical protein RND71_043713 [Anisodus tanguticus]
MANSIASVVATYDSKMINYMSKCVVQPSPRLEIVKLDEIMYEMLQNFIKINNFRPDFIIMYRDGVSESQFNEVINKELKLMKSAFSRIDPNYAPRLTFIVVQKRHHVRFLPSNPRNRLNSENVKPGTVIDNTIVSNYYHEFFLCAHYGALGTSRPTRYIVLHDESEFSGDEIQRATNNLSYLFPRCLKAVSVPPPVLYSHLAAKRARSYLITLDNNRGLIWGENPLEQNEIDDLVKKIKKLNDIKEFPDDFIWPLDLNRHNENFQNEKCEACMSFMEEFNKGLEEKFELIETAILDQCYQLPEQDQQRCLKEVKLELDALYEKIKNFVEPNKELHKFNWADDMEALIED